MRTDETGGVEALGHLHGMVGADPHRCRSHLQQLHRVQAWVAHMTNSQKACLQCLQSGVHAPAVACLCAHTRTCKSLALSFVKPTLWLHPNMTATRIQWPP